MKLHALVSFLFTSLSLTISANPQTQSTAKPAQRRSSSVSQRRALKKSQSSISNATASHYVAKRAHKSRRTTQQTKEKSSISWVTYSTDEYTIRIPNNWQCINDKTQLPEKLDVVFIGQGTGSLTPTINISQEIISKNQPEYIEEILAYHKANDMTLESSVFTHIQSLHGEFTIIKTEKNSSWGRVFCLQGVAVINHKAYIFTSTATLDDYPNVSLIFLKTVSSFKLSEKEATSGDTILREALKALQEEIE
ncbi:hypothetical protein AO9_03520 [Chlamydia psittaci Mat116]|uniref:DUF1795 domain-containing protein n=1 Tax=Chlamydia psittaci 99DC5 TaxID=1112251 RepID=A0ABP2X514_CHLPS|nr:hypothetical protein [Chlamydia psittaci]AGE75262.1 hypothetical protein AO9_03520 [Chlamydia psittaci Mat116]EPJ29026.1 hypothetical protein CP99DC5_0064 [Chlamydia psittaci 99DC5]